ncbi:putative ubiquinone biosynthesis monooxygenase [Dimargaris verticillata]|uniref:Ubiquinone biosynthesis monooxygenase COQ6, mitochondrial n=1 Tax=Dimargaris verticillata TaxID=2761393 RepID=A0A9W8B429_9FUNG|nr:putative ubiquinone biosynthesis monooxygenase [Dimargaris verticillata]
MAHRLLRPSALRSGRHASRGQHNAHSQTSLLHSVVRAYSTAVPAASEPWDVVIVGGGIVGAALACGLGASPLTRNKRIALVESSDLSKVQAWAPVPQSYSSRTVSITPGSYQLLKQYGVWDHIELSRTQTYTNMAVWDAVGQGQVHFGTQDLGLSQEQPMAWIMENLNLHRAALRTLADACPGVTLFDPTKVESIQRPALDLAQTEPGPMMDWPRVKLSTGQTLMTRLLIGADGARSPVRQFAKIDAAGWSYPQHGIVGILKATAQTAPQSDWVWQRFLPTGPVALLPLPGEHMALVWSMDSRFAAYLKQLPDEAFTIALNAAIHLPVEHLEFVLQQLQATNGQLDPVLLDDLMHRAKLIGASGSGGISPPLIAGVEPQSRASFPFRLQHADRYVDQRLVLIGDAAHTIHPLAGQGLNLGLADVASLVPTLEQAVATGQDLGDYNGLLGYASARYAPNLAMLGSVDKLQKLFSTGWGPVATVRSLGLNIVNHIPRLKRELVKTAML